MKNNVFQLSHRIKKYLEKQVVTVTYTLEQRFFAVATFEGLFFLVFFIYSPVTHIININIRSYNQKRQG